MPITNSELMSHPWLRDMYDDGYFPNSCVDMLRDVLVALCETIEASPPADLKGLYALTHRSTEAINDLEDEFIAKGSEIETAARDCLGEEFHRIAQAYGFGDADIEELIAPREW